MRVRPRRSGASRTGPIVTLALAAASVVLAGGCGGAADHRGDPALQAELPVRSVIAPRPKLSAVYNPLFEQFLRAFQRNRSIFHALNGA